MMLLMLRRTVLGRPVPARPLMPLLVLIVLVRAMTRALIHDQ
jgi:hypothetical protein